MLKSIARHVLPKRTWRRLHAWRVARGVQRFPPRIVQHRYHEFDLQVHLADGLAQGWYDSDWPLMCELSFLQQHRLKPGARVFDCGAHQGVVAMMLGKIVGPSGSVLAVECMEHNASMARRNMELNALQQVKVLRAGVSSRPGELRFGRDLNSSVNASDGTEIVPAVTIDQLASEHGQPDVLFIDVEGYELHALQGATETLRSHPNCFVEVHVKHGLERAGGTSDEVLALLKSLDYNLFVFREPEHVIRRLADCPPDLLNDRYFLLAV